jgi:hypothetical protein
LAAFPFFSHIIEHLECVRDLLRSPDQIQE